MECEYGMYDHTDSSNSQLLSQRWPAVTFNKLSGHSKDDFISYYNLDGGLEALLTWSSGNCCFLFSELDDVQLSMKVRSTRTDCHAKPEIGENIACNPSSGYQLGKIYSLRSQNECNNGSEHELRHKATFDNTSFEKQ